MWRILPSTCTHPLFISSYTRCAVINRPICVFFVRDWFETRHINTSACQPRSIRKMTRSVHYGIYLDTAVNPIESVEIRYQCVYVSQSCLFQNISSTSFIHRNSYLFTFWRKVFSTFLHFLNYFCPDFCQLIISVTGIFGIFAWDDMNCVWWKNFFAKNHFIILLYFSFSFLK